MAHGTREDYCSGKVVGFSSELRAALMKIGHIWGNLTHNVPIWLRMPKE
jgi:hypothetical protein